MTDSANVTGWPRRYGRYLVFEEFARGGMASVHLGRLVADRGFSRLVAIKMLSHDRDQAASSFYARALEDEARIASRVRHPNVVQPLDVVAEGGDLLYVMEYVHGVSLAELLDEARARGDELLPRDVCVAVMLDILSALHAAHEAKDETGRALGVVHRDVSPQNVLVGLDGLARLADFGVAKAARREERTATGAIKGKLAYMPPEQQRGLPVSRQADVYAAGVVLAVALTNAPPAPLEVEGCAAWLRGMLAKIDDPVLLDVVTTATKPQSRDRYATAAEMAAALAASPRATPEGIGACVQDLAGHVLDQRSELAKRAESEVAVAVVSPAPSAGSSSVAPSSAAAKREPAAKRRIVSPFLVLLFGASVVVAVSFVRNAISDARSPAFPAAPGLGSGSASSALSSPSPSPSPSASASASASAPSASPLAPASAPPRARPRARPTDDRPSSPPAPDCDPPFRIDAQGRKHYKPECAP